MLSPDLIAEQILDELRTTDLKDLQFLEAIAWERGATVRYEPLRGAEARLVIVGNRAIITVSDLINNDRRQRFSIAHELGHLEIHRHLSSVVLCGSHDIGVHPRRGNDDDVEQEANRFASALLMPKRFFAPLCKDEKPSLNLVAELANTFYVSVTAAALRYLRFCDEPCAVVFSRDGYIEWFQINAEWEEVRRDTGVFVDVHSKVDPTTIAAAHFVGHTDRDTPKRVRASAWFKPGRYRDDATIVEQSWAMPGYNAVLTLLWIDDDIENDDDSWLGSIPFK
jgi:hypothetical protein